MFYYLSVCETEKNECRNYPGYHYSNSLVLVTLRMSGQRTKFKMISEPYSVILLNALKQTKSLPMFT